jgi:hypothetical protein
LSTASRHRYSSARVPAEENSDPGITVAARFLADSKSLEEGPKFGEHLAGDETPASLSAARFVDVTDAEISLVIEIPVIKQVAGSQVHSRDPHSEPSRSVPFCIRWPVVAGPQVGGFELVVLPFVPFRERFHERRVALLLGRARLLTSTVNPIPGRLVGICGLRGERPGDMRAC